MRLTKQTAWRALAFPGREAWRGACGWGGRSAPPGKEDGGSHCLLTPGDELQPHDAQKTPEWRHSGLSLLRPPLEALSTRARGPDWVLRGSRTCSEDSRLCTPSRRRGQDGRAGAWGAESKLVGGTLSPKDVPSSPPRGWQKDGPRNVYVLLPRSCT